MKVLFITLIFILFCGIVSAQGDKSEELGFPLCLLDAVVNSDNVKFTLTVLNESDTRIVMQFPTSQQYDFIVKSSDDKVVWKWSEGRMFSQSMTTYELDPNEKKIFEAECILAKGEYKAQAEISTSMEIIQTGWKKFSVTESQERYLTGKITKILDKIYFLGDDGTAYHVVSMPENLKDANNKKITVTSCQIDPIPGSVDEKIIIDEYKE
jgi:hypothetical protein